MDGRSDGGRNMKPLPYDFSGIALLYVEDETTCRTILSKMLATNYPGLKIYSAENGAVGLDLYIKHAPDIVMTDINMPVKDGIRMSMEIKAINPQARIIAVTAYSDASYLLSAIRTGIDNYVLKPINQKEIFGIIDKIIEQIMLKRMVKEQNLRMLESERQLSGAQRIARLGSWQRNLADGSMNWSDELYRIYGFEPGAIESSYPAFLERFIPEDRERLQLALQEAIDRRQPLSTHFCSILRADGPERILRVEAEVILDDNGEQKTMIGICHDVSELKRAEEQIRCLTDDLERRVVQRTSLLQASVKELEAFSYFVSHDLRAPLARLEGFCRAMVEDCGSCSNSVCMQYAERAEHAVLQIKHIIEAFNNLTHFTKCSLVVEKVDLSSLARDIADSFKQREPDREVEFVIADAISVRGDPRLLQIVLEHLLDNAWKFTSKKSKACIEFGSSDQDGVPTYFVRDNGAGFDMRHVDNLFKPFQTVHSPGEYPWNGTAIGLATVHSIILRHGGRIWAQGEIDRGATFYFTLDPNPEPVNFLESN